MHLVYPPPKHTTPEASTFIVGSVTPGSTLLCEPQGEVLQNEAGYFSVFMPLELGENMFTLSEYQGETCLETHTLVVLREGAPGFEFFPQGFAPYAFPQASQSVLPGAVIQFFCIAPPESVVEVSLIGAVEKTVALDPLLDMPDKRTGVFAQLHHTQPPCPETGFYAKETYLPCDLPLGAYTISYHIETVNQTHTIEAPGTLTVADATFVQTICDAVVVRTMPETGARLTPLPKGVLLKALGSCGNWVKVTYSQNLSAWIHHEQLETIPPFDMTPVMLHLLEAKPTHLGFTLEFPLSRLCPWHVQADENRVQITLYGMVSQCDFIHYTPGVFEQGLKQVHWQQTANDTLVLTLELDQALKELQGWFDADNKIVSFYFKTQYPQPFRLVIDPGHGGEESGATAPDGTPEKDLNLSMALQLKAALKQIKNLDVILTRSKDETVSLADRTAFAESQNADLFISLHHNALPDGRDPRLEQGICTFYYHGFALPYAQTFQQALTQHTDFPDYGILYDSLYVCRMASMPAVLIELGFVTHPDDAIRILSPAHQSQTVQALVKAIQSILPLT